jgi:hypothetical protein
MIEIEQRPQISRCRSRDAVGCTGVVTAFRLFGPNTKLTSQAVMPDGLKPSCTMSYGVGANSRVKRSGPNIRHTRSLCPADLI